MATKYCNIVNKMHSNTVTDSVSKRMRLKTHSMTPALMRVIPIYLWQNAFDLKLENRVVVYTLVAKVVAFFTTDARSERLQWSIRRRVVSGHLRCIVCVNSVPSILTSWWVTYQLSPISTVRWGIGIAVLSLFHTALWWLSTSSIL